MGVIKGDARSLDYSSYRHPCRYPRQLRARHPCQQALKNPQQVLPQVGFVGVIAKRWEYGKGPVTPKP